MTLDTYADLFDGDLDAVAGALVRQRLNTTDGGDVDWDRLAELVRQVMDDVGRQ